MNANKISLGRLPPKGTTGETTYEYLNLDKIAYCEPTFVDIAEAVIYTYILISLVVLMPST